MKPSYILGINAYHGDVSAVLVRDGQLVAAVEEERFRRIKHWAGFPTESIRRCLEIGGIRGGDVAHVAVSRDPKANVWRKVAYTLWRRPSPRLVVDRLRNAGRVRNVRGPLAEALGVGATALPEIHHVEHHPAHLASAFYVSPFEDAAVGSIDGFGDFVSTSMAVGRGRDIELLEKVYFPHSLGILYTAITQYLGFLHYGDEYKVMGLAPYGRATRLEELRQLVTLKDGGTFELSLDYFRHWSDDTRMEWEAGYPTLPALYSPALESLLGPARNPEDPVEREHEDVAHSLQALYEECCFHILDDLWERTRNPRLCLAGGCAMNSVANGKVRDRTPFEALYVQPAAADNGTALGAAYHVWHQVLGQPRAFVMDHAYWGTAYPDPDVPAMMDGHEDDGWTFEIRHFDTEEDACRTAAELIPGGHVVGWFQGCMEWGARALGNRSILADPRREDTRDHINTKIKFRERFRPFAPSVLEESLDEYFVGAAPDPFMQQVYLVREEMRPLLPAITHVDGTGRIQTVNARINPTYHRLISAFGELTGVPIVLNTSLNENEPIVDTPEQALDCFLRTRMDAIVIDRTMVRRQPAGTPDAEGP